MGEKTKLFSSSYDISHACMEHKRIFFLKDFGNEGKLQKKVFLKREIQDELGKKMRYSYSPVFLETESLPIRKRNSVAHWRHTKCTKTQPNIARHARREMFLNFSGLKGVGTRGDESFCVRKRKKPQWCRMPPGKKILFICEFICSMNMLTKYLWETVRRRKQEGRPKKVCEDDEVTGQE